MQNVKNNSLIETFHMLDRLVWDTVLMFEELGEDNRDAAWVVLGRAVNSQSTLEDVRNAWNHGMEIEPVEPLLQAALNLYTLVGPSWPVICSNLYLLKYNDAYRDDGDAREDCPLFGDSLSEVEEHWWERINKEYDQAQEAAAA